VRTSSYTPDAYYIAVLDESRALEVEVPGYLAFEVHEQTSQSWLEVYDRD
jgi:hypothetical protein